MSPAVDAATFYRERVPRHFNRVLEEQERLAAEGNADASRLAAGMKTVTATIRVEVEGDASYALNVFEGRMRCDGEPAQRPFMTLAHDLPALVALQREAGDSVLGLLGGIAGLGGEMKLTSQRLQNLRSITGALRFELTGDDGFSLVVGFGVSPLPAAPACTLRIDADAYRRLRSGELAPQDAFLSGQIEVEGDMQIAMQLALAALSPE